MPALLASVQRGDGNACRAGYVGKQDSNHEAAPIIPMQRVVCIERDDWRATAASAGFDFHTVEGERYWDERAYYAFTLDEIERQIEQPTGEIDAMCLELVGRAIDNEDYLRRLKIPEAFWSLISESWHR